MMAAAEARAVWQRTANRCFVQEDAKRAPKLACCQSSSSTSKQVDASPTAAAEGPDHPPVGFMPLDKSSSYSILPPDTRWWLHLQPSYGSQKGLTFEQLSALEVDVDAFMSDTIYSASKPCGVQQDNEHDCTTLVDDDKNTDSIFEVHSRGLATCVKKDFDVGGPGAKVLPCKISEEHKHVDMNVKEMNHIGCPVSKLFNELCSDSGYPLIGYEKAEPWWRTTDRDELASLVAQKSLDHVGNCDLPPPQKKHVRRDPSACLGGFESAGILSSLDQKDATQSCANQNVKSQGSSISESTFASRSLSFGEKLPYDSDKSVRYSFNTTSKDMTRPKTISESDASKAQLLEALCHSQTRAREAEEAAKQAHAEKEHILKLFFRQASQLFAYKHWFQLLQLEALYDQIKSSEQPISSFFPVVLPLLPYRDRKLRKGWQKRVKGKRYKRTRPNHDITKYAVAFALGLSLVGAGLLLGWTVGWMLPSF